MSLDDMLAANSRMRRGEGPRRSGARAVVFWMIALVAGSAAALLLKWYIERSAGPPAPPLARLVVASMDLPIATTIRAEHIRDVEWPEAAQPIGALRDTKEVIGRVTVARMVKGEPILSSKLAVRDAGRGLAALIPDNLRAVAVRVDDVVGVAGFIHPEDRVDVIVTLKPPKPADAEPTAKVILQNVKVLSVGKELDTKEGARSRAISATVATLLVTPEESERLALAANQGRIMLTLRSWTDDSLVETTGANPSGLLSGVDVSGRAPVLTVSAEERVRRPRQGRREPPPPPATAAPAIPPPPPPQDKDVVEILRGDRFEQRKFEAKPQ